MPLTHRSQLEFHPWKWTRNSLRFLPEGPIAFCTFQNYVCISNKENDPVGSYHYRAGDHLQNLGLIEYLHFLGIRFKAEYLFSTCELGFGLSQTSYKLCLVGHFEFFQQNLSQKLCFQISLAQFQGTNLENTSCFVFIWIGSSHINKTIAAYYKCVSKR